VLLVAKKHPILKIGLPTKITTGANHGISPMNYLFTKNTAIFLILLNWKLSFEPCINAKTRKSFQLISLFLTASIRVVPLLLILAAD